MKRHPAMQALSSDHHHGLVQARRLVQTASTDQAGPEGLLLPVARAFLTFWAQETQPHFAHICYEEDVVFPLLETTLPEEALAALPAAFAAFAVGS